MPAPRQPRLAHMMRQPEAGSTCSTSRNVCSQISCMSSQLSTMPLLRAGGAEGGIMLQP